MSPTPRQADALRVAVLDDQPAVRTGLEAIFAAERDIVSVGAVSDVAALLSLVRGSRPSLVVLDLFHPGIDGLTLASRLKRTAPALHVVLYSGAPLRKVAVAAALAGIDAVVSKADPPDVLLRTLRAVAAGRQGLVPAPMSLRRHAASRLDQTGRAVVAMRLDGTTVSEIAQTLRLDDRTVDRRLEVVMRDLVTGEAPS